MRALLLAGVAFVATASGCRTAAAAATCQSPLASRLSPEEEEVLKRLPDPQNALATHDLRTDVLWGGILEKGSLPAAAWNQHLAELYDSNADVESQALLLVQRRYWEAFRKYGEAIEVCKPRPEDYDGSWVQSMRKQFGGELKLHAKALRNALGALRAHSEAKCSGASAGELLVAELTYRAVFEDQLRDWEDFVRSTPAFSPQQKAALIHRADVFAWALHKVSATRVMLDTVESTLARFEAVANQLPPDMAAALNNQRAFSKPFHFVSALDDLNRVLE